MSNSDDIMAGRAVVEIAGDKEPFEQAVVASQGALDKFKGRIEAMSKRIEASIAPVGDLSSKFRQAFEGAADLASKLGFEGVPERLQTIGSSFGQLDDWLSTTSDSFKGLGDSVAKMAKGGMEGFSGMLGAIGNLQTAIENYIELLGQAADLGRKIGTAFGEGNIGKGASLIGEVFGFGPNMVPGLVQTELAPLKADAARKAQEDAAAAAKQATEDAANWAAPAFDATGNFFRHLESLTIQGAENLSFMGQHFAEGIREGLLTFPIQREIDRLTAAAGIREPERALTSGALRGSQEAANIIARNQAVALDHDKNQQLEELRKHTQLLDQIKNVKAGIGLAVKIFNG